jgi:hypothetical protein
LPNAEDMGRARGEAAKLSRLRIGSIIVPSPAAPPTRPGAFDSAVAGALLAVKTLQRRDDVDPHRIGIIREGVRAHIGAVAMGREPTAITAAAFAEIGGRRGNGTRAMTRAELKRLMFAAPPGTLLEQDDQLGPSAEAARDRWIRSELLAR